MLNNIFLNSIADLPIDNYNYMLNSMTRKNRIQTIVTLVSTVWLATTAMACDGEQDGETSSENTEQQSITALTFNTALGVGLAPYTAERREALAEIIPDLGIDLICLQEVWTYDDVVWFKETLAEPYPHVFFAVEQTDPGSLRCTSSEADMLSSCLDENCTGLSDAALVLCAVDACAQVFTEISADCQECIIANQTLSLDILILSCGSEDAKTYKDQNGLMILSKYPFENTGMLAFDSALGDRGVLRVRIAPSEAAGIDVYCTHLAASIGESLYQGEYGSWEEERYMQAGLLLDWVEEQSRDVADVLVLGDLNCGPATADVEAEDKDTFMLFSDSGFTSPYLELGNTQCSWCADNTLVDDDSNDVILDHVLQRTSASTPLVDAGRSLTQPVEVEAAGEIITIHLSDHYGIFAKMHYQIK
jgi:endonuclease/exonuclease/phosphatase family metal-dependent hydrolase